MGLGVEAYSKIIRSKDQSDEGGWEPIRIWRDAFELCEFEEGHWELVPESREHQFRTGSYSEYNLFRDTLAMAIHGVAASTIWENEERYEEGAFIKLIHFSDCSGMIGSKISSLLHRDFVENRERFIRNISDHPDFLKETLDPIAIETEFPIEFGFTAHEIERLTRTYDNFMLAFEIAADDGVVLFC